MSVKQFSLYDADANKSYQIITVPDVKLLQSLGIFPGSEILKKHSYKLGGPVRVMIATREVAIGKDIANKIIVKECA